MKHNILDKQSGTIAGNAIVTDSGKLGINLFLKDGTESIKIPFERCKFIHQIQNIYYDLTGKELIQ